MLRDHLHLDRVTQVGLVGAVPQRRVFVGYLRPLRVDLPAPAKLLENAANHRLDRVEHVLLRDKAHLQIKLVEISGRAIRPRVFIPETRRDLEIFVKARHHQQLFELLRRLRQGVELARMQPRRHQKIPRALRARRGDNRRLIFAELLIPHPLADGGHDVRAQLHILLHRLAAQVQKAVFQPGLFRVFLIAEHDQRQLIGFAQNLQIAHKHLNLAGRDLVIDQLRIPRLHRAVDPDAPFRADRLHLGENRAVGVT